MPSVCEARRASSYSVESMASASSAGSPTSASAASIVSRSLGSCSLWKRVPMAVYSGPSTSGPYLASAATHTRTGPQALASPSRYFSGRSSLSSLSTARLITCQRRSIGRAFWASSTHREVIQAHGHSGSNQKSTTVGSCSGMLTPSRPGGTQPTTSAPRQGIPHAGVTGCRDGLSTRRRARPGRTTPGVSTRRGYDVAGNLTREEARQRAALLDVESYAVELDLTGLSGGALTFASVTVVRFRCSSPGAATFADLSAPAVREITLN